MSESAERARIYGERLRRRVRASEVPLPEFPAVGDGVTIATGSDRSAGTVVRVEVSKSGRPTVFIVGDKYEYSFPSGYGWNYRPGDGPEIPVFLRFYPKRGGWRWVTKGWSTGIVFGRRDAYRDPHF